MNLIQIYSVPFWQSEYLEFENDKENFLNVVEEYRKKNLPEDKKSTNIIGNKYANNLHHIVELKNLFEDICKLGFKACADLNFVECDIAITSAWLNVNFSRQCMSNNHVHKNTFSGVFYLKAPEESGKLVIENPSINKMWDGCDLALEKNQFTAESVKIEPIEGNIILFPSYLPHSVETNNHDEERISISFEMIALPKGQMKYQ